MNWILVENLACVSSEIIFKGVVTSMTSHNFEEVCVLLLQQF